MTENILAMKPKPFSWSYTHIKNFNTCPRRYNEIDLLKNFKEEKSQQLKDGDLVHKAMADRLMKGTPLPINMPFEHWINYVTKAGGRIHAELKMAITKDFEPCEYFDPKYPPAGYVSPIWLRSAADVIRTDGRDCHIIDWKTGQVKPDKDQLMLLATCAMVHFPQIFNIKAEYVWLAYNTQTTYEFTVDDIVDFWPDSMLEKVEKLRLARLTNDFPPKPSGLCKRWCVVTSCEHCGQ